MSSPLDVRNPEATTRLAHRAPEQLGLRVPVVVQARDPISREGTLSALKQDPRIEVREKTCPGGVILLVDHVLGPHMLTELRRTVSCGDSKAVLVVETLQDDDFHEVMSCGVGAVVWRHEATRNHLVKAVLAAARGDGDFPADLLGRLIRHMSTKEPQSSTGVLDSPGEGLTPREVDVMRLVAEGLGTATIAAELCYSERTIKDIMYKLTTRLSLRNRAHAVAYALRKGYI